ncbi:hypothetical protein [Komagataeibacter medellinensis]|uniref:hypothetical protein n=1 Tax=Komagataeibacter medellinensis TaxID=1177712 RepID=UPI0012971E17|nr:hypothetical protein [Komagataeibacter medellinensis]
MPQFIEFHDISTSSNVIINKHQIVEIRERHTDRGGHDHYEIKFLDGTTIKVRDLGITMSHAHFLAELNKN